MAMKRQPPAGNVRRVQPHPDAVRYTITSKAGDTVQCESHQERAWILGKDRERVVRACRSQPTVFTWRDEKTGKEHTYVPDFMIWPVDGPIEIHEITRAFRRSRSEIARREEEGRRICRERGWRFFVHTEEELPGPTEVANLLALVRFRPRVSAEPAVAGLVHLRLRTGERAGMRVVVDELSEALPISRQRVCGALYHMLWHGDLYTELATTLIFDHGQVSSEARLWLPTATMMNEEAGA